MTVFFKNLDYSEALAEFINDKGDHLHGHQNIRWIISKEKRGVYLAKAVTKSECFTAENKDPRVAINDVVHNIKAKESKQNKKSA